ncbi:hypothetical protein FB565_000737 [Actinoplanes lutulentus]|nr:DUF5947 family protein [Actinoplanes lutulentus]MBB2941033.1 hypothetical protein [Actinoplanes lutulentus]
MRERTVFSSDGVVGLAECRGRAFSLWATFGAQEAEMTSKTAVLRTVKRQIPRQRRAPRCGVCATRTSTGGLHLVDLAQRSLVRGCADCHQNPGELRPVPDRYLELPGEVTAQETWDDLHVPAGLAFVWRADDRLLVCGPAPDRAVEHDLPVTVWERMIKRHPAFATLRPGVEALIIRRAGAFLVPIDACYELAGLLRTSWRGFDGARDTRGSLTMFFAKLSANATK